MFQGRRPFRRPLRPPAQGPHRLLRRADQLLACEQFTEAAGIFEQLSIAAKEHSRPGRAGELAIQASRAHIGAHHAPEGVIWAQEGLRLLIQAGRIRRAQQAREMIMGLLRENGLPDEASQLGQDVGRALDSMGIRRGRGRVTEEPDHSQTDRRRTLPARCSGCGAALIPDEVIWHDADTEECVYCGTILKDA